MAKAAIDLSRLTPAEKIELIEELWVSIDTDDLEVTPEQREELDRRLERLEREGPIGTSWESVRAAMSSTVR